MLTSTFDYSFFLTARRLRGRALHADDIVRADR